VLFQQLANELATSSRCDLRVIDTSRERGIVAAVRTTLIVTFAIVRELRACDVASFHSSRRGAAFFAPIVRSLCFLFGKPWIFRGFGDFQAWHEAAGFVERRLFDNAALRADIVLVETKSSEAYFRRYGRSDVRWYPNSRPLDTIRSERPLEAALRFVFIGHVKPSKGIRELLRAANDLDDVSIDVFGPLTEGVLASEFVGGVRYRGPLRHAEVASTLRGFDVLLLPTYYEGEGYPGIILEAFAQGVPVIATHWRSIPEIVSDENGVLVAPRDWKDLARAMRGLSEDPERYRRLRAGTAIAAAAFSSLRWTEAFALLADELARRHSV
jgi:glycosyltransferase involved in cell wall biosynthesis